MPDADAAWVDGFLDGFLELADRHRVSLVGGDTTRGPLSVCVTVHGFVEPGRALRRAGARVGDDVWVSGTLGDAAGALTLLMDAPRAAAQHPDGANDGAPSEATVSLVLRERLDRPDPRVSLGIALAKIAHAAIDVSDGLFADLGHVAHASGVGAGIVIDQLPTSAELRLHFSREERRELQATGGDDYELCFVAPVAARNAVQRAADASATPVTRIGTVVEAAGVRAFGAGGEAWHPMRTGHEHFR